MGKNSFLNLNTLISLNHSLTPSYPSFLRQGKKLMEKAKNSESFFEISSKYLSIVSSVIQFGESSEENSVFEFSFFAEFSIFLPVLFFLFCFKWLSISKKYFVLKSSENSFPMSGILTVIDLWSDIKFLNAVENASLTNFSSKNT